MIEKNILLNFSFFTELLKKSSEKTFMISSGNKQHEHLK